MFWGPSPKTKFLLPFLQRGGWATKNERIYYYLAIGQTELILSITEVPTMTNTQISNAIWLTVFLDLAEISLDH
jgi:hypothetical protein